MELPSGLLVLPSALSSFGIRRSTPGRGAALHGRPNELLHGCTIATWYYFNFETNPAAAWQCDPPAGASSGP